MSVALPTFPVLSATNALQKAMLPGVEAAFAELTKHFDTLSAVRVARENAEQLWETSDDEEIIGQREVVSQGQDKIEELQAQIARINADCETLKAAGVAKVASSAGMSAEELATASEAYLQAQNLIKAVGGKGAIFPEVNDLKFPNVAQITTGKGATAAGKDGIKRLRANVEYNGTSYETITAAAQAAKVDGSLISAQYIIKAGKDTSPEEGESVTVTVTDNGKDHTFTLTHKVTAKPGRKAAVTEDTTTSDSADVDVEPTAEELENADDPDLDF